MKYSYNIGKFLKSYHPTCCEILFQMIAIQIGRIQQNSKLAARIMENTDGVTPIKMDKKCAPNVDAKVWWLNKDRKTLFSIIRNWIYNFFTINSNQTVFTEVKCTKKEDCTATWMVQNWNTNYGTVPRWYCDKKEKVCKEGKPKHFSSKILSNG